jgi:hypothetical protein
VRVWTLLRVGALMLATVVLPSGVWGATMDDVKREMAKSPSPWHGTRLLMYVPLAGSGNTLVSMSDLCVSGGRLRRIADGATGIDVGPAPQDNQYLVHIVMRDGGGYDIYQYEQMVTLPSCK